MRQRSNRRRSNESMPHGGEEEIDRLAQRFTSAAQNVTESEERFSAWAKTVKKYDDIGRKLTDIATTLTKIAGPAHTYAAEKSADYVDKAKVLLADSSAELAARYKQPKGRQRDEVMRFFLLHAIDSYSRLFNKFPGTSHADRGPFGRYVDLALDRVPAAYRPKAKPSAKTLTQAIKEWKRYYS